jgi:hypothetical protein
MTETDAAAAPDRPGSRLHPPCIFWGARPASSAGARKAACIPPAFAGHGPGAQGIAGGPARAPFACIPPAFAGAPVRSAGGSARPGCGPFACIRPAFAGERARR